MTEAAIIYWSAAIPVVIVLIVMAIADAEDLFGRVAVGAPIGIIIGFGLWFFG